MLLVVPYTSTTKFSGSQKKENRGRDKKLVGGAYAAHRQPAHHLTHQRAPHFHIGMQECLLFRGAGISEAVAWPQKRRDTKKGEKAPTSAVVAALHFPRCRLSHAHRLESPVSYNKHTRRPLWCVPTSPVGLQQWEPLPSLSFGG